MWDDVEIVDLDQAKAHVRLTGFDDEDDDLQLKLRQAHELVLDHVSNARDADYLTTMQTWDGDSAPKAVQAAILRMFAHLYRYRGDDEDQTPEDGQRLPAHVRQLLGFNHTPTVA